MRDPLLGMCFFLIVKWQINYKLLSCVLRSWGRQVLLGMGWRQSSSWSQTNKKSKCCQRRVENHREGGWASCPLSSHTGSHVYKPPYAKPCGAIIFLERPRKTTGDWAGQTGCRLHLSRAILSCLLYPSTQEPHGRQWLSLRCLTGIPELERVEERCPHQEGRSWVTESQGITFLKNF